MKASFTAVCATAVVVAASAVAGTQPSAGIRPEKLARVEAITSYCEKANPAASHFYLAKLTGVTQGHSNEELQRSRASGAYLRAFNEASLTLSRVTGQTGAKGCRDYLSDNE